MPNAHTPNRRLSPTVVVAALATACAAQTCLASGTLSVVYPGAGALEPGDLIQVKIRMTGVSRETPATGFQAFLEFDSTRLSYLNGFYTSEPFGLHILGPGVLGDTINMASGVNVLIDQPPSSADADLAVLTFQVLTSCGMGDVVFREHSPLTTLADIEGDPILPLTLNNLEPAVDCPGDVQPDGAVNVDDLIRVILGWGSCASPPPTCCPGDTDASGSVDVDDLIAVILSWGGC